MGLRDPGQHVADIGHRTRGRVPASARARASAITAQIHCVGGVAGLRKRCQHRTCIARLARHLQVEIGQRAPGAAMYQHNRAARLRGHPRPHRQHLAIVCAHLRQRSAGAGLRLGLQRRSVSSNNSKQANRRVMRCLGMGWSEKRRTKRHRERSSGRCWHRAYHRSGQVAHTASRTDRAGLAASALILLAAPRRPYPGDAAGAAPASAACSSRIGLASAKA